MSCSTRDAGNPSLTGSMAELHTVLNASGEQRTSEVCEDYGHLGENTGLTPYWRWNTMAAGNGKGFGWPKGLKRLSLPLHDPSCI